MGSVSRRMFLSGVVLGTAACQPVRSADKSVSQKVLLTTAQKAASLPRAPFTKLLPPTEQRVSRIYVASCLDEEKRRRSRVLDAISRRPADLLLMLGDNVYGDRDSGKRVKPDAALTELRSSFAELARRADFAEVLKHHPVMVAWDDHDYGKNDAGREFSYKLQAEQLHEHFWGLDQTEAATHPGTYYARQFGPIGSRLQVIMLDTRSFRSPLTKTDQRGAPGKERYVPSERVDQDMLGAAQWQWLAEQMAKPADLRVIASSIQVLPTNGHGFESWSRLPTERNRLLSLVSKQASGNTVFVSGDRHRAFLYRQPDRDGKAFVEMTSSSINLSSGRGGKEMDRAQLGASYVEQNFGELVIDWDKREVELVVRGIDGQAVNQVKQSFKG